jgi:hypothetical protein
MIREVFQPGDISYLSSAQAFEQSTIRVIPVEGVWPHQEGYFIPKRPVYLVTQGPPSPQQQQAIDLARLIWPTLTP